MKKKVLLGMSGGVDSSVAAAMLLENGYDVTGVTMELRPYIDSASEQGACGAVADIADSKKVADKLGIEHMVLDFTEVFNEAVISYFVREYQQGRTPNPCIACNAKVKFTALLDRAKRLGFDYIATGHYATVQYDNAIGRWLLRSTPSSKDQSYVLYTLTQEQLAHTLFPLAGMEKEAVRKIAKDYDLPVATKPDSQEICFVPDKDYVGFIEKYTGQKSSKGNFIDQNGNILGEHGGILRYTIGQRKGLGISLGKPMYVTAIDKAANTVTLGEEGSQYKSSLVAENLNFIPFDFPRREMAVEAKVRYQAKPAKAKLIPIDNSKVLVEFETPQRSVTPGQAVVFYEGDLIIGGGTIM